MLRSMFVFVAATALPAVAAQTIRPEEAAKMFGARESVSSIDLFPDGRRLVYVAPTCGGASAAYLMDMAGGTPKPLIGSRRGAEEELAWCAFGSNTRLVCQLAGVAAEGTGLLVGWSRLVTFAEDGSEAKPLGQQQSL